MKLLNIELSLFRQHRDTSLYFIDGLTGVIGPNGSGKSTLMEAIVFALFGTKALRGSMDYVRTRGVPKMRRTKNKSDDAEVRLNFEHDGVAYRVVRTLTDAKVYMGGETEPISTGSREVTQRISSILGMSFDEFLATYFTEQKGLEFLSAKKGAAERERFLVKMMGYDKLEEVHELLKSDRKDKRALVQGFEAGLGSREDIEARIKAEDLKLVKAREDLKQQDFELEINSRASLRLKEDFERIRAVREKFEKMSSETKELEIRISEREKRQLLIQHELAELESNDYALLREQSKNLAAQVHDCRSRIRNLEQGWLEAISSLKAREMSLKEKEKELQSLLKQRANMKGDAPCPTCGQALGSAFHHAREHLEGELQKVHSELALTAEELKKTVLEPAELKTVKPELANAEKESNRIHKLLELEHLFTKYTKERDELSVDLGNLKIKNSGLQGKMSELKFDEPAYLRIKGEYDTASRLVEVVRLRRVTLAGEVSQLESHLERTKDELMRYDSRVLEIGEKRNELIVYDCADEHLVDFRRYLNEGIRPRLAELASEYLAELTDGRYTMVDVAQDFSPSVMEDGETKSVISGGEEDVLNLCMRLALSHMLAERAGHDFSLLILDEVFGSLDEARRANVLLLLEKLKSRFEQILLITHLEDVREGVENLIVVEYDEGTAEARIASSRKLDALGDVENI